MLVTKFILSWKGFLHYCKIKKINTNMGVGSWGQRGEVASPWVFKHGTDFVDRGKIVVFFDLFCYFSVFFPLPPPSPWKMLNSAIFASFWYFLAIFWAFFRLASPWKIFCRRPWIQNVFLWIWYLDLLIPPSYLTSEIRNTRKFLQHYAKNTQKAVKALTNCLCWNSQFNIK